MNYSIYINRMLERSGYALYKIRTDKRVITRKVGSSRLYFLHVPKTAGNSVLKLLRNKRYVDRKLIYMGHWTDIWDIPVGSDYVFGVRNPINRFVSGFYSSKNKGRPQTYVGWSSSQLRAFKLFSTPNELAEALFKSEEANCALNSIPHIAIQQADYFRGEGFFLETRKPLAILRQENLRSDLELLLGKIGVSPEQTKFLVEDNLEVLNAGKTSHENSLSELAISNLRKWYARDFVFYETCNRHMNSEHRRKISD